MNTDILEHSTSSERLRQARLEITIRIRFFRFRRRKKRHLTLFLSLIQPRLNNVPLLLATQEEIIELRSLLNSNIENNLSGKTQAKSIFRTFQIDLTRPGPQRSRPSNPKRYQRLSKWKLPNFSIALGCEVERRYVNCSKYRARVIGSPRLILQTVWKNKFNHQSV